ncbi:MAG TPA: FAD-binding oxidoreductase [Methylophilaceae bacterium]|nr:FAD-binding oxidoreductase [Methylophilaceae bacterium]
MLLKKELGVIENSYYEASVKRSPSSEPLTEAITADVCVVGGGYAGLSAGLELSLRGYSVVLLEAQRVGWGASGRNGGQVIVGFGEDGEEAIESQLSREDARRAWEVSIEGLNLLRERIAKFNIECDYTPGFLNVAIRSGKARALHQYANHLQELYGYPLQWVGSTEIREWLNSERFCAGVYDPKSGHLHPLKYCLGLAEAARNAGVRLHENSPVYVIQRGSKPVVRTGQGEVRCDFVVLAGNVYLGEYGDDIAPELMKKIMPVGTYMIATEPMPKERADSLMPHRSAVSDNNFVLDYFRLSADHRLLFGAGDSYSGATPRNLVARIRKRMLDVFPQLDDLAISHAWGGFVDMTWNMAPHFGRLGTNIYYLQGFSGHGLAFSGMAGKLAAEAIAGQAERFDLFSHIKHYRFPGGAWMRTPAIMLGVFYYRLRDLM